MFSSHASARERQRPPISTWQQQSSTSTSVPVLQLCAKALSAAKLLTSNMLSFCLLMSCRLTSTKRSWRAFYIWGLAWKLQYSSRS